MLKDFILYRVLFEENVDMENNDLNYRTSPGYIEKLLRNPLLFQ